MQIPADIELLTAEAYAKRFQISRTTVFEWKKRGVLIPGRHYIKIGNTLRFMWHPNLIRELHNDRRQQSKNREKQEMHPPTGQKGLSKKIAIDLKY